MHSFNQASILNNFKQYQVSPNTDLPGYHGDIDQLLTVLLLSGHLDGSFPHEANSVATLSLPFYSSWICSSWISTADIPLFPVLFECLKSFYSFAVILVRLLEVEKVNVWDQSTISNGMFFINFQVLAPSICLLIYRQMLLRTFKMINSIILQFISV